MENNKRNKQIEIARQRLIKRRWLKRMVDFDVFQTEVYSTAKEIFGVLRNEVKDRLDLELTGIKKNNRTIMLATMVSLMSSLESKGIASKLSLKNGYNVSLVCYVLGINIWKSRVCRYGVCLIVNISLQVLILPFRTESQDFRKLTNSFRLNLSNGFKGYRRKASCGRSV